MNRSPSNQLKNNGIALLSKTLGIDTIETIRTSSVNDDTLRGFQKESSGIEI